MNQDNLPVFSFATTSVHDHPQWGWAAGRRLINSVTSRAPGRLPGAEIAGQDEGIAAELESELVERVRVRVQLAHV